MSTENVGYAEIRRQAGRVEEQVGNMRNNFANITPDGGPMYFIAKKFEGIDDDIVTDLNSIRARFSEIEEDLSTSFLALTEKMTEYANNSEENERTVNEAINNLVGSINTLITDIASLRA